MSLRDLKFKVGFEGDESAIKSMDGATSKLKDTAEKAGSGIQDMGKKMGGIGKKMTAGLTLPIVAFGAKSLSVVADFDDSMSRVGAISGTVGDEFEDLRKLAIELGSTTAHSASAAASGMEMLAASGKSANEILEMTPQMLTLMSAGGVDAEVAAKTLTGTMAQFNLTADDTGRIVDVFSQGAMSANTNVGELQEGFKMAGGELANMNMDIEQSTAMFDIMAEANIVGGQAGQRKVSLAIKKFIEKYIGRIQRRSKLQYFPLCDILCI